MAVRRVERSEIWTSGISIQIQDTCEVMLHVILGVIRCISDFQQPCVSKTVGFRAKHNLNLYVIQFYVVIVCHLVKQRAKPLGFLFSSFALTWGIVSKCYAFYKSQVKVLKLLLIFSSMVLTKLSLGFFKF